MLLLLQSRGATARMRNPQVATGRWTSRQTGSTTSRLNKGVFGLRIGVVHHLLTYIFVGFVQYNGSILQHIISHKLIISTSTRNCDSTKINGMKPQCSDAPTQLAWVPQTKHPGGCNTPNVQQQAAIDGQGRGTTWHRR